jgi:hypothetical protein
MGSGLKWIASTGGPLLLIHDEDRDKWLGVYRRDGDELEVDPDFTNPERTDYGRACSVSGLVGFVDVGGREALVFGDEPAQTAWRPDSGGEGGTFARWIWADDEAAAGRSLDTAPPEGWEGDGTFVVDSGSLLLLDSAEAGSRVTEASSLQVVLEPGEYTVETLLHRPDDATFLILHRLRRK